MLHELLREHKKGNVILFVGAGVSANLNIPTWNELINHIASELGYDPDIYRTFGDNYSLAEYYKVKVGSIGPLLNWLDRNWHSPKINIKDSSIHKKIVNSNFPVIYTTNYDRWIELAYDAYEKFYKKIVNVADLKYLDGNTTQIVKFHGDFYDESSIVLGESSYFDRLNFEGPLDLKLRSDVLGKSVLFIGYSLQDINLRLLFYKLAKLWKNNDLCDSQPKSYVFSPRPNPIQKKILEQWGIEMITPENDNPGEALDNFLSEFVTEKSNKSVSDLLE